MSQTEKKKATMSEILDKAGKRALGGGLSGAAAMAINIGTMMWLRTTMNYQYRYGTTTTTALKTLYKDGGIPRFYRGVIPALFQGPLSRFGDTAANSGVLMIMDEMEETKNLPTLVKSVAASLAAASWRVVLMPIDATKTIMQVEGKAGFPALVNKVRTGGPLVLWHGAGAAVSATFVGHYPWFATFNALDASLPGKNDPDLGLIPKLARRALMGFSASCVSDTCSNSIRVIKTVKQSSKEPISYPAAVKMVLKEDGVVGLFGRGLKTRILANGLQGLTFAILWKAIEDQFFPREKKGGARS